MSIHTRYNVKTEYHYYQKDRYHHTPASGKSYSNFGAISPIEPVETGIMRSNLKHASFFDKSRNFLEAYIRAIICIFPFDYDRKKNSTPGRRSYTQRNDQKKNYTFRIIGGCITYVYTLLVYVCFFDCWILSRFSKIRTPVLRHRKINIAILLLPFAILLGHHFLPAISPGPPSSFPSAPVPANVEYVSAPMNANVVEGNKAESLQGKIDEPIVDLIQRLRYLDEREFDDVIKMLYTALEKSHNINFNKLRELVENYGSLKDEVSVVDELSKRIEVITERMEKLELQVTTKTSVENHEKTEDRDLSDKQLHDVEKLMRDYMRQYEADKTGKPDYALESAGGQVITTRNSERFDFNTMAVKLFGITLFLGGNSPRTVIQRNAMQPGNCWAFHGFPGTLVIKLRCSIFVTGFSIEHVPKTILPIGSVGSAPRHFTVLGMKNENDMDPVSFGSYEFLDSDESLQYFQVQNTEIDSPYKYVELRITSNHGHPDFTCIYRFRVHGEAPEISLSV